MVEHEIEKTIANKASTEAELDLSEEAGKKQLSSSAVAAAMAKDKTGSTGTPSPSPRLTITDNNQYSEIALTVNNCEVRSYVAMYVSMYVCM
jgi:hypothetical protein